MVLRCCSALPLEGEVIFQCEFVKSAAGIDFVMEMADVVGFVSGCVEIALRGFDELQVVLMKRSFVESLVEKSGILGRRNSASTRVHAICGDKTGQTLICFRNPDQRWLG